MRADWTSAVWPSLCLLTLTSALAAATGLLWTLSPVWQAVAVVPGLLVMLCVVVASWADWSRSGGR